MIAFARQHPIAAALVAILTIAFAAHSLAKPKYAMDGTQYVGCILSTLEGGSWAEKRARTYDYLASRYPEDVYRDLTTAGDGISPYRQIVASDPEAFRLTQPVYCYKIGFVWPATALVWMGVDPHWALRLLSALPAAALFGVTAIWLSRRTGPGIAVPMALIGLFAVLFQTGRYEYPDGMTALLIGLALISHAGGRLWAAVGWMLAAMIVRADAVIYLGAYLGIAAFFSQADRRMRFWGQAVPAGIAGLVLYAGIVTLADPPGYGAVFHHSLIAQTPYLSASTETVTLSLYADVLIRQLGVLAVDGAKLFVMIPLAAAAWWVGRRETSLGPLGETALAGAAMVILHFTLFPYYDPRYYAGPYLFMIAAGGAAVWVWAAARYFRRG